MNPYTSAPQNPLYFSLFVSSFRVIFIPYYTKNKRKIKFGKVSLYEILRIKSFFIIEKGKKI